LEKKSPGVSGYIYCFDNPLVYTDPDGKYPVVVITNTVTGYTVAKVYGKKGRKVKTVIVPTYKAIVYDYNEATGEYTEIGNTNVTRDGWYNQGTIDDDSEILVNRSTEPKGNSVTVYAVATVDYGDTKGAYALDPVEKVPLDPRTKTYTNGMEVTGDPTSPNPDIGEGVMIHVGGYYVNPAGEHRLGGTYGCFGVVAPEQIFHTKKEARLALKAANKLLKDDSKPLIVEGHHVPNSNAEMDRFVDMVNKAKKRAKDRGEKNPKPNKDIRVKIIKRSYEKVRKVKE
jgi:hypothetical protein